MHPTINRIFAGVACILALGWCTASEAAPVGDSYTITLDPTARAEPATGRVILFFITETRRPWPRRLPIEGPFFEHPQPIASMAVSDFKPGESVTISGDVPAFPQPLDSLDGTVRVQAILDADNTQRSHEQGPGNVFSDVVTVELNSDRADQIELRLTHRIEPEDHPEVALPNLKWVRIKSELLSKFYGRDVHHRAGVALPAGYDDPNATRTHWPAIYEIPGFGGRDESAVDKADMQLHSHDLASIAPIAVWIVLDPESPLGHHGFVDSPNHGPRRTALVTELIPHLEKEFRLIARPEARIITGHSSGGWSSLWLALQHPEVFGACWSSAPDPIDFTAFQMTNLYDDADLFVNEAGEETPSFRMATGMGDDGLVRIEPVMTVRQETAMERAIDPVGGSGQQWDAWEAMFSPRDERTGMPRPLFDAESGAIDKNVVEHWSRFDIARMVIGDWEKYGPIISKRVRLAVGDEDSFYLNRAVDRFAEKIRPLIERLPEDAREPGYVLIVPRASHDSLTAQIFMRWNEEMRAYLIAHGLQEVDAKPE